MDEWIDYYDSTHTIYVSSLHRDVHFRTIADDIIGYIPSADATVLDYSCGEALFASRVAAACGRLILAEPAPGVRGRLIAKFGAEVKIKVRSIDELRHLVDQTVDLVVMNSVAQYMTPADLDTAFALIRRLLKTDGRFVWGMCSIPMSEQSAMSGPCCASARHMVFYKMLSLVWRERPCRTIGSCASASVCSAISKPT